MVFFFSLERRAPQTAGVLIYQLDVSYLAIAGKVYCSAERNLLSVPA